MTSQVMTTETILAQRNAQQAQRQTQVGLVNLESFELSQRIAKMLSASTLVPEQYRQTIKVKDGKDSYGNWLYRDEPNPNGLANCVIALNMANRLGADPLMVMQNLYLIEGRPAWSSQFIMAAINSCGRFSALRFQMEDLGEKEVTYQETVWQNRQKSTVTKTITIQNFSCVAFAIERETGERIESSKITMEMAVKEGWYQKNGSKWQTMPEQMLRYRAASFFGRVYAPELLMGLKTAEEEHDHIIDITPEPEPQAQPATTVEELRTTAEEPKAEKEVKKPRSRRATAEPQAQPANDETIVQQPEEVTQSVELEPTTEDLFNQFKEHIDTASTFDELSAVRRKFAANAELSTEEIDNLLMLEDAKAAELRKIAEKPQLPTNPNIYQMLDSAQSLQDLEPIIEHINNVQQHKLLSTEGLNNLKSAYAQRKEQLEQPDLLEQASEEFTGLSPQSMRGLFGMIESQTSYPNLTMTYKSEITKFFNVMTEDQRNEIMVCYEAKMDTFK